MGYKTPLVCKEVYLPIEYDFINDHNRKSFKEFSKDYLTEYGIDLHDVFEMVKTSSELFVNIKPYIKLSAVSISGYPLTHNMVNSSCVYRLYSLDSISSSETILIEICVFDRLDNFRIGFGLMTDDFNAASIDDLLVTISEI